MNDAAIQLSNARASVPSNKTYTTLKARLDDEIGILSNNYILVYDKQYKDLCPKDGSGVVTDWLPAINQAMLDVGTQGRPILLPYGNIPISNSIIVNSDSMRIVGFGKILSKIKPQGAFPAIILNGLSKESGRFYTELKDFQIDGGNVATVGVQMNFARECWINDCYIIRCVKGVTGNNSWSNGIRSSEIGLSTDTNVELGAQCNDFQLIDVQMDSAVNYGFRLTQDAYAVNLIGCCIQNNGKDGILLDGGRGIMIQGIYMENNNTSQTAGVGDIRVNGGNATVQGLSIIGGQIWSKYTSAAIVLNSVFEAAIIGMSMGQLTGGTTNLGIQTSSSTSTVFMTGNYSSFGTLYSDSKKAITRIDVGYIINVGIETNVSANRPASPKQGQIFLDTTVGGGAGKPLWYNGSWKDAHGVAPENGKTNVAVTTGVTTMAFGLVTEPDVNYSVYVTPSWNTTWWVTPAGKLTTGFNVNFGTAAPSGATVDWTIKR